MAGTILTQRNRRWRHAETIVNIVTSILLAMFTFALVCLTSGQSHIAQRQKEIAESQRDISRAQGDTMTRQTGIMVEQAKLATKQTKIADKQRELMIADQRAWILPVLDSFTSAEPGVITFNLRNYGKGPAFEMDWGATDTPDCSRVEVGAKTHWNIGNLNEGSPIVPPGTSVPQRFWADPPKMPGTHNLKPGESRFWVMEIFYRDQFGLKHTTTLCLSYNPRQKNPKRRGMLFPAFNSAT